MRIPGEEMSIGHRTYWIVFTDPTATSGDRFRGVVILELPKMDLTDQEGFQEDFREIAAPVLAALEIDPTRGAEKGKLDIHIDDVTDEPRIKPEHKGKLLLDDALLVSLGSTGRNRGNVN
jgi:hypothetical protein